MNNKFAFLKSLRFWKLFIIALLQFLGSQGIIDPSLATAISVWLGGSVLVRTVDRHGEKVNNH